DRPHSVADGVDGRCQLPGGHGFLTGWGPPTTPIQPSKLVGCRHANHRPEVMRTIFPAARSLERSFAQRGRQRHQVSTCRLTDEENPVGVNGILSDVGMKPTDGTEHVLVTGRRRGTTEKSVVNRHGEEAEARPLPNLDGAVGAFRFPEPAATVDREDDGERAFAFGVGEVRQQARPLDPPVNQILLHDDPHFLVSGDGLSWLDSGLVLGAGDEGDEDASDEVHSEKDRHWRLRKWWRAWPGSRVATPVFSSIL